MCHESDLVPDCGKNVVPQARALLWIGKLKPWDWLPSAFSEVMAEVAELGLWMATPS